MIVIRKASEDDYVPDAHSRVCDDIIQIAGCDSTLSFTDTMFTSPYDDEPELYSRVEYTFDATSTSAYTESRWRLSQLAGSLEYHIIIHGVGNQFHDPAEVDPTHTMGWANGGLTLVDQNANIFDIFYDVSDNVHWYLLMNPSNQSIVSYRTTILYHELMHCFGDSTTTFADGYTAQRDAIAQENVFRQELKSRGPMQLRNPDPNAPYAGWGHAPQVGGTTFPRCERIFDLGEWIKENCLIATAATGSPDSPIVLRLHEARAHYQQLTDRTALQVLRASATYRKFSPLVVQDMALDASLARSILMYAVLPLPKFIDLIDHYRNDPRSSELPASLDEHVSAYISDLRRTRGCAGCLQPEIEAAAEGAAEAARQLASNSGPIPVPLAPRRMPEDLFKYLASMISSTGADTSTWGWGLTGMALFLRRASDRLATNSTLDRDFIAELDAWLLELPIPTRAESAM
jgi:hypothetical protein